MRPGAITNAIFLYCLAAAAQRFGMLLHTFCVLSNHYHLVVTDVHGNLPAFEQYLNQLVARALNASLGRWESFWAPGSYSAVRLVCAEDIIEKTAYTLANPVAAALVPRGERWPGLWSRPEWVDGPALHAKRPEGFFRENGPMAESYPLVLVRPPCFETTESFVSPVRQALRRHEDAAHARVRESGRSFLGEKAVLRQSPRECPETSEPRRGLNPRVAARDRWKRIEALGRLRQFLVDYRRARDAFWAGVRDVVFPAGTYSLRLRFGVCCASP